MAAARGLPQTARSPTPAMHTRHCLKIADRMHALLLREIGQGLDARRLLAEPRYARDVLLVCEALRTTDGPLLAHHYRRAAARAEEPAAMAASSASAAQAATVTTAPTVTSAPATAHEAATAAPPRARVFGAWRWLQGLVGTHAQPLLRRSSAPPSATWSPTP